MKCFNFFKSYLSTENNNIYSPIITWNRVSVSWFLRNQWLYKTTFLITARYFQFEKIIVSPSILLVSLDYYSAISHFLTPPDEGRVFFPWCQLGVNWWPMGHQQRWYKERVQMYLHGWVYHLVLWLALLSCTSVLFRNRASLSSCCPFSLIPEWKHMEQT